MCIVKMSRSETLEHRFLKPILSSCNQMSVRGRRVKEAVGETAMASREPSGRTSPVKRLERAVKGQLDRVPIARGGLGHERRRRDGNKGRITGAQRRAGWHWIGQQVRDVSKGRGQRTKVVVLRPNVGRWRLRDCTSSKRSLDSSKTNSRESRVALGIPAG